MLSKKIKQLRLSKGWSLDELSARIGGIVTKQSLSKYELGTAQPSATVLNKIAAAFGVKTIKLLAEQKFNIEFIAYRKRCSLPKKEQNRIENFVRESLEERLKIQNLVCPTAKLDIPVQKYNINELDEVEKAADSIRTKWSLGRDQISSITDILENKLIHILEIDANNKFDGMAAVAYEDKHIKGIAIVVRRGTAGERHRLNLAHELGHVVLKVAESIDEEKAAFRFGAAFLAPEDLIKREVGDTRKAIDINELFILKNKFGLSIQSILFRLKDLGIISESYCVQWFRCISKMGWRKEEPNPLPIEKAEWLKQNVYKAFSESLLSQGEAESLLGEKMEDKAPLSLKKLRSFMKLPIEERRRILAEQVEKSVSGYEEDTSRDVWQGGSFVE
ncbi:MAG: XRE family transcriptional regulator [Candidatus Omnitrophica bacterium]|nr:XRE family transcriptional regulator [Candidatus Omnitrophota bacterium]MBU1127772.1 XRE family transcriptional regulator [Candidatus Omnitrophota bacterium]MBU1784611.1 XRE family transcriptional regulator [Candidatus Omnitrophota bacterium]MBU1852245.1 XRE family transcriptional regulator [Candidatus Omnitrophota bacterium]